MPYLVSLLCGALFGVGLTLSGMINPARVVGFLDIFGAWDPTLAFVMGGALAVFMPSYFLWVKPRPRSLLGAPLSLAKQQKVDAKLVIGAATFGIGWGLAGICPGPALALLSVGNGTLFSFILALCGGILIADRIILRLPKNH